MQPAFHKELIRPRDRGAEFNDGNEIAKTNEYQSP